MGFLDFFRRKKEVPSVSDTLTPDKQVILNWIHNINDSLNSMHSKLDILPKLDSKIPENLENILLVQVPEKIAERLGETIGKIQSTRPLIREKLVKELEEKIISVQNKAITNLILETIENMHLEGRPTNASNLEQEIVENKRICSRRTLYRRLERLLREGKIVKTLEGRYVVKEVSVPGVKEVSVECQEGVKEVSVGT